MVQIERDIATSGISQASLWLRRPDDKAADVRDKRRIASAPATDRAEHHGSVERRETDRLDLSEGLQQRTGQKADGPNRTLRFYRDENTGRMAAKVVDRSTGEVLSYIPPEEVLHLAERLAKAAANILADEPKSANASSAPDLEAEAVAG